jgi:serine protease Do
MKRAQVSTRWVAYRTVIAATFLALMVAQVATAADGVAASKSFAKELSAAFRNAAKDVLPSVVSIQTNITPTARGGRAQVPEENPFQGTPFEGMFDDMLRNRGTYRNGQPRPRTGMGSGIVIDSAGIILTNNHVVAGGKEGEIEITVRLLDGRQFKAEKVKSDERTDLAVVWIKDPPSDLKAAKLGDSDQMDIGDWVLAVGHPFGLFESVTAGIISAKGRGIGVAQREDFLQTDAAINPGNSGGPLINLDGQVVGINTAISTRNGGYQGAGFAIPSNLAKWVIRQLIETGSVRRAYLGTAIGPVTQELSEELGVPVGSGAFITAVFRDSPADKAGLKPGDVVVEFAGKKVTQPRDLVAEVEIAKIGSRQPMTIVRDGDRVELQVQVELQPKAYGLERPSPLGKMERPDRSSYEQLGLEVGPVTEEAAKQLGLDEAKGALITSVAPGGTAASAGLARDMIITQANRKTVQSVEELNAIIEEQPLDKKGLLLLVRTPRGSQFFVLRLRR